MGYCCVTFDDNTKWCYSNFTEATCINFPRGTGVYYPTQQQCFQNCGGGGGSGLPYPPSGGSGGAFCVDSVTRTQCSGTFIPDVTCSVNPCEVGSGSGSSGGSGEECLNGAQGICCKSGACVRAALNEGDCCAAGGVWHSQLTSNFTLDSAPSGNRKYNLRPCDRLEPIPCDPGAGYNSFGFFDDCEFCKQTVSSSTVKYARPVLKIIDTNACPLVIKVDRVPLDVPTNCQDNPDLPGFNYCSDILFNGLGIDTHKEGSFHQYCQAQISLSYQLRCPWDFTGVEEGIRQAVDKILGIWGQKGVFDDIGCVEPTCCECIAAPGESIGIAGNCVKPYITLDTEGAYIDNWARVCAGDCQQCAKAGEISRFWSIAGTECVVNDLGDPLPPNAPPTNSSCCDVESIPIICPGHCLHDGDYEGNPCSGFTVSALTNVKIYLNSVDYICAPIACGECTDYELCGPTGPNSGVS